MFRIFHRRSELGALWSLKCNCIAFVTVKSSGLCLLFHQRYRFSRAHRCSSILISFFFLVIRKEKAIKQYNSLSSVPDIILLLFRKNFISMYFKISAYFFSSCSNVAFSFVWSMKSEKLYLFRKFLQNMIF